MRRLMLGLLGALLVVVGIAALVVAHRHHPQFVPGPGVQLYQILYRHGWSTTAYDAVRIGGSALIVFGAVIAAFALVRELRAAPR